MKTIEEPASEPKLKENDDFIGSMRCRRNIARDLRSLGGDLLQSDEKDCRRRNARSSMVKLAPISKIAFCVPST